MTRVFGRIIPKLEVEALTWTLSLADRPAAAQARTPRPRRPPPPRPAGSARSSIPPPAERGEAAIHERTALQRRHVRSTARR